MTPENHHGIEQKTWKLPARFRMVCMVERLKTKRNSTWRVAILHIVFQVLFQMVQLIGADWKI